MLGLNGGSMTVASCVLLTDAPWVSGELMDRPKHRFVDCPQGNRRLQQPLKIVELFIETRNEKDKLDKNGPSKIFDRNRQKSAGLRTAIEADTAESSTNLYSTKLLLNRERSLCN